LLAGCLLAALFPPAPAAAAVDELVQVRPLFGNSTEWVSPDLYVAVTSPTEYVRAACCADSNSGAWEGPTYTSISDPSIQDVSTIDWSVSAVRDQPDAASAAIAGSVHGWPIVESGTMSVPVMQNGELVRTVDAYWALTRCDYATDCAQYEGLVSFYIGNAIHIVARFAALAPSDDGYTVEGGRTPSVFNADVVREAIATVRLEGPFDGRCADDPAVVCGGSSADVLEGTDGPDTIFGGGGDDTIDSGDGDDVVGGDAGNDTLRTGAGNDEADGGTGNDRVFMGAGDDLAKGGAGHDLLEMAEGLDRVNGGGGRDVIDGGAGFDRINGGKGFDKCFFSSRKEKKAMQSCEKKVKRAH
jgi:hypothetical protein